MNRAIFRTDNAGQIWDVDNFSVVRGPECPTVCGADGIEAGEDCEHTLICSGGGNDGDACVDDAGCPDGACLAGDLNCPGRCRAVGADGECTCDRVNTSPCATLELDNGFNSFITDGGWYTFVADTPSTAIESCGSSGFDSYLVIFDSDSDCTAISEIVRQDDCGSDSYGTNSDPLASCFDAAGAGAGPGPPFDSCFCIPTTIGKRYWVWEARAGGLGSVSVVSLDKRITCEALYDEGGACCNDGDASCRNVASASECTGRFETFTVTKLCESPSVTCVESVLGACCDKLDGFCSNTLKSDCTGSQPNWTPEPCAEIVCDPAQGACCNTRFGTCTQDTLAGCQGANFNWTKGAACSEQTCPDPFVPTVSEWGLVIMTLLLLIGAKVYFGRRGALA